MFIQHIMKKNSVNKWNSFFVLSLISFWLLSFFFFSACAKKASPEGGPYDMAPPKLIYSFPKNGAVNVKTKRIKLHFDENVKLERQSEKVIFSPPQKTPPHMLAGVGKKITIKFEEPLLDSTTYVIDFSDAIVDLNEGNPIDGFSFAFSTGPVIDTMIISGIVLDAQTLQPLPNITVGLYKNFKEEDLTKKTMLRATRTTETGSFELSYLSPGEYTLFAIDDIDRSFNYTGASEGIAFLDYCAKATLPIKTKHKKEIDSLANILPTSPSDSLGKNIKTINSNKTTAKQPIDSISLMDKDSLSSTKELSPETNNKTSLDSISKDPQAFLAEHFVSKAEKPNNILLFSRPTRKEQKLQRITRPDSLHIQFHFTAPLDTLPLLKLFPSMKDASNNHRLELDDSRMELTYWITDSTLYKRDTLQYQLSYQVTDSLMHWVSKVDTLSLVYRSSEKTKYKPQKSIFARWADAIRAKKAQKRMEQTRLDSIQNAKKNEVDTLKIDPLKQDSISSPKAIDSLKNRILEVAFKAQPPLRRGHPNTPLYLEFSEPIAKLDTARIHLYYIKVDSTAVAKKDIPNKEIEIEKTETRQDNYQDTSVLGGGASPYESGLDRYGEADDKGGKRPMDSLPQREKTMNKQTEASTLKDRESANIEIPKGERIKVPYDFNLNPLHARQYRLKFEPKFGSYYLLSIDSVALQGIYNAFSPKIELPIKIEEESKFGSLQFKIDSMLYKSPAYFELLNETDSVLITLPVRDTITIENIAPATYFARLWFDLNKNTHWDAGSYPSSQPEPLFYYPKTLEVKSKFTQRILWKLDALPLYEQHPKTLKKEESKNKEKEKRERKNLNEEYIARMRERYGDKWNPTNRDRRMLGMPSRKEEKEAKKKKEEEAVEKTNDSALLQMKEKKNIKPFQKGNQNKFGK